MAFETDCGSSTVLGTLSEASTARPLVSGDCLASTAASRGPLDEVLRTSATPTQRSEWRMKAGGRWS